MHHYFLFKQQMMNIAFHHRALLRRLTPCQRLFSSQKDYARSYLANWAGTNKNEATTSTPPAVLASTITSTSNANDGVVVSNLKTHGLQVTGSSYLLPTLCLPKYTTAASLAEDLSNFLEGNTNNHAIRSILKPKPSPGKVTWRVPIILDLSAFQHDGSPHYLPPNANFLSSIVETLDVWGISIMGLTNVQTVENVTDEIHSMGLPVLGRVGSGRTLGKGSSGGHSVGVEELVQLVMKQSNDENSLTFEDEKEESRPTYENKEELTEDNPDLVDAGSEAEEYEESTMTRKDILNLSFRELQKECKFVNLGAKGPTAVLQERLLEYRGFDIVGEEDDDDEVDEDDDDVASTSAISEVPQISIAPKIYHGSVRSGQQVSSDEPNQSLVILGNVNSGGEVMADGDIYIFGALRGRALAGLSDASVDGISSDEQDLASNIICSNFDAELVCIGENFTTVASAEELGLKRGAGAIVCRDENGALKFIGYS